MCVELSDGSTISVDAAGGKKVKTTGDHCWEIKHLFYISNGLFPSKYTLTMRTFFFFFSFSSQF